MVPPAPLVAQAGRLGELQVHVRERLRVGDVERLAANKHDEEHHAEREDVHGRRVRRVQHHLRRHKARRAERATEKCTSRSARSTMDSVYGRCVSGLMHLSASTPATSLNSVANSSSRSLSEIWRRARW